MSGDQTSILVVDDEAYIRTLLVRWLEEEGYACRMAENGEEAWRIIREQETDLLISDVKMPGLSGLELLGLTRSLFPPPSAIMVTAVDDRDTAIRALELGASGYVLKPFERNEIVIHVASALEQRRLETAHRRYQEQLEEVVRERTRELRQREEEIAWRLALAAERRDRDTGEHIRRIGLFSAALAEKVGWPRAMVDDIRVASIMHDIGKIGIPDAILQKPGRYSDSEYKAMQEHPRIGAEILEGSQIPMLQMAREIALCHHERWDGKGYPQGLAGEDIPESARIVTIVDVYDAMVSERVYKESFPEEEVIAWMKHERGQQFDPRLFALFLEILPRLRQIRQEFTSQSAAS